MDRFATIVWMAEHSRSIIDAWWAKRLAADMGIPFDRLTELDPNLIRRPRADGQRDSKRRDGWLVPRHHLDKDLVQVSDLAAVLAWSIGEFANIDHAKASQHATKGREAQYVCQRACVRTAFHFFGKSGHTDRYGDDPAVVRLVLEVPSIRTAGVQRTMKGPDGRGIIGFDGKPILTGGDQILIEKVYKPQVIEHVS